MQNLRKLLDAETHEAYDRGLVILGDPLQNLPELGIVLVFFGGELRPQLVDFDLMLAVISLHCFLNSLNPLLLGQIF